MAYLEIGSRSKSAPALSNGAEFDVSETVAFAIAEQASEIQRRFLAKIGLTVRQAKRLKPTEKEDLERKYTAFLLG